MKWVFVHYTILCFMFDGLYKILDWDLNVAQVTPAVYLHLNDFNGKLNFRY